MEYSKEQEEIAAEALRIREELYAGVESGTDEGLDKALKAMGQIAEFGLRCQKKFPTLYEKCRLYHIMVHSGLNSLVPIEVVDFEEEGWSIIVFLRKLRDDLK